MKSMKAISSGLCLVAMLAVSMVAAGTASAAPHWLTCREGSGKTKYTTEECTAASSTGNWQWEEDTSTEAAISFGTLILRDIKIPIVGTVEVSCTGEDKGSVGPGPYSRTTEITNISCTAGKNCEKLEAPVEPLNLKPGVSSWQGELTEESGQLRNKITSSAGSGAGWKVICKVLGVTETDECTTNTGYTVPSNLLSPYHGTTESTWLVLLDFNGVPKAKCKVGGAESGEVLGSDGILTLSHHWGLLVTK